MQELELFERLGIALAIGLLIGVERGWKHRDEKEGARFAGLRTFGLVGLTGGLCALLAQIFGALFLGFAFAALTALVVVAHTLCVRESGDYGITTAIAALATFAMGALAVLGDQRIAAAAAVVTAVLLGSKSLLHRWLKSLQQRELYAGLQLLVITVVILPLLPNRDYGPFGALNPYVIWWMIVLISGISFIGYFTVKIAGTRLGIMLTALFGGLASSTAVTLHLARLGKENPRLHPLLASAVIVASATMLPRLLILVGIWEPRLLSSLWWPVGFMFGFSSLAALGLWFTHHRSHLPAELNLDNPLELATALKFGLLLVLVMLLAEALRNWWGEAGVVLLAGIAGLSDIDAITLSISRMSSGLRIDPETAGHAIVLAAVMNTVVKGAISAAIAGGAMARRVALVVVGIAGAGALGIWMDEIFNTTGR
ncbi:MAG: MgtC/SapB family protein [Gammaproteobacteria bacterium]